MNRRLCLNLLSALPFFTWIKPAIESEVITGVIVDCKKNAIFIEPKNINKAFASWICDHYNRLQNIDWIINLRKSTINWMNTGLSNDKYVKFEFITDKDTDGYMKATYLVNYDKDN